MSTVHHRSTEQSNAPRSMATTASAQHSEDHNSVQQSNSGSGRSTAQTVSALNSNADSKLKKNRPKDTRLRQQNLPAWQPILTASSVIPAIFAVGIIFLPIGVALFLASEGVQEKKVDYTDCPLSPTNICTLDITIEKAFEGDVYFYYALENYYQNLRRYMKSRSDAQLIGDLKNVGDCAPYAFMNSSNGQQIVIAPCGAVANSMFNDTFLLFRQDENPPQVPWTYKGVAWPVDKERKFKNPTGPSLREAFAGTTKPPNWQKEIWQLDESNADNNGFLNSDFIVWMRTAALPNFRKLYRILVRDDPSTNGLYSNGLPAGSYRLTVNYNYPVTVFNGRKAFVISTASWAGGKNSFLGIAYMVVGSICIVLGFVFLLIHLKFGTRFSDVTSIAS